MKIVLSIILTILHSLMTAWAGSTTWNWFVAPNFNTIYINGALAVGLSLVISVFSFKVDTFTLELAMRNANSGHKETTEEYIVKQLVLLAVHFVMALTLVGMGFIVKGLN